MNIKSIAIQVAIVVAIIAVIFRVATLRTTITGLA